MKASIKTNDFVTFLKLFGEEGQIGNFEIGDTLYKREGWIDKSILNGKHSIEEIVNLNYEFNGIHYFKGKIGEYQLLLKTRIDEFLEFEIESIESNLRILENKVIERNANTPGLFYYSQIKQYEN